MRYVRLVPPLALLVLAGSLSGCFNPFDPTVSTQRVASTPPPTPSSPANAIKLFEWCYANRAITEYSELFTDDYRFQFALGDSAGNLYRDASPWTREDELATARNEFVGGPDKLPAKKIDLTLAQTLIALNDSRPGKNSRWHKQIRTSVNLQVVIDHGDGSVDQNAVEGNALFFLVRGDSAAIPPELAALGFTRDSTRWWIERWEDETLPASGGVANRAKPAIVLPGPSRRIESTFGAVKTAFR